jgi:hypothetical protein
MEICQKYQRSDMQLDQKGKLKERIREDLLKLVYTTLSDEKVGPRINSLMDELGVSAEDLKQEVLAYTLDKAESNYDNAQYQKLVARLTLYFHNLVPGSYHTERQEVIYSFLEKADPAVFMDVGYGVPGLYLTKYLSLYGNKKAILLDQDPSAETFSRKMINFEFPHLQTQIEYRVYDMDSQEFPGDSDVYLYLDSIEHTRKPTEYLNMLVHEAKRKSYFIFSIPICPMKGLEGFHYAEWLSDRQAREWVENSGLCVTKEKVIHPNPNVDFFAELGSGKYHNYLVLGKKV